MGLGTYFSYQVTLHTIEREMVWIIAQQLLLLIGAMVLLFAILFYFNIKPLLQLTQSIQESPGALPSFYILEFNTLRNAFLKKYEEVSALNANLEEKVKERTATLARTNELFAKAQAIAHLGNWEWNIVENTVHWSDEIYRIFGLQPKAFAATYEAFINTVHPQDRDLVQKAIEQFLLDGKTYDVKHRIVLPTGEIRIVAESGHMSRDKDGNNLSMFGTVQDITDQQTKEDELSLHDEILNSLSDSIFVHQENGRFIYVNEAACATRGFSQKELLNMTVSQLDAAGFYESVEAIKEQIMQTGSAIFEVAHRRKSGAPIPVEIVSRMIQRDGQTYFISIARDITQRKETEKQIIESEAKFRALVENSLVGVYQSDVQGNIHYVNDALVSIMEYESIEALMETF
ncbi:MAG TPA: PAS domain S-box protein [Sulfuricurvum sp.]|nr:PAS domain S-box protein [Sulfuricurvum sp.]HQT35971.1 PAS domain S-box protein [Sulfuricurvum sp.]